MCLFLSRIRLTAEVILNYRLKTTTMEIGGENTWRGVPITEIFGALSPWGAPEFPLVAPGFNHAVLYHIPAHGSLASDRCPKPQIGQDKWDQEHVRMPCSSQSLYPVEDSKGEVHLKKRWEIIENALSKQIHNSQELASTILSYNTKFKNIWKFGALHKLFTEHLEEEESEYFFAVTLPEIAKLALALPKLIQAPIQLLKQHKNRSISLSQQQISSLLANAFFCTFPRRNTTKKSSEYASYPYINFNTLYDGSESESVLEKLKCICHYFRRVTTKVPVGVVTFSRRSVPPRACPKWLESERLIGSLPIHVDSDTRIEDAHGLIQIDFANKYLGGGVLNYGCVQEEIRFVICPELMISMLFTEVLRPNEALMMIGSERYSEYSGYGSSFLWRGEYVDMCPHDSSGRRRCAVLAIDAQPYANLLQEYKRDNITRELNKAWVGFSCGLEDSPSLQYPGVATGNWGCGAFGGSEHLKSLIQLMACAQARRPMAYYTFGDVQLRDEIVNVYNMLSRYNVTVGQLYKYLLKFCDTDVRRTQLHAFLHQVLIDKENSQTTRPNDNPCATNMETMEPPEEITCAIEKEFLTHSPDLFSQDDVMDESLIEVKIQSDKDTGEQSNDVNNKEATSEQNTEQKNDQTTKLFEEMGKLDSASGRLNLSSSNTSTGQIGDLKMDQSLHDASYSDPKRKLKRIVSTKMTDFFSKKSI